VAINWIESTPATDDLTGDYHAVAGVRGLVASITFSGVGTLNIRVPTSCLALYPSECKPHASHQASHTQ
jgi:hypothetical protein